jgi:hypothetical protein
MSSPADWGRRDPFYTLEKLRKALRDFDEAEGAFHDRLYEAWFQLHLLTPDDFPVSMQSKFQAIVYAMTYRKGPTPWGAQGRIGDARNTMHGMHKQECVAVIGQITALIEEVERSIAEQRSSLGISIANPPQGAA